MAAESVGIKEMDRSEAVPLTSERRYGIYRTGLAAATVLIIVLAAAGIALLLGVRDATVLLCILLPLLILSALIAHLFLWLQHKRAVQRRERAATEWVSTTYRQQQRQPAASGGRRSREEPNDDIGINRFAAQRASNRSTPPPGYLNATQ